MDKVKAIQDEIQLRIQILERMDDYEGVTRHLIQGYKGLLSFIDNIPNE